MLEEQFEILTEEYKTIAEKSSQIEVNSWLVTLFLLFYLSGCMSVGIKSWGEKTRTKVGGNICKGCWDATTPRRASE